MPINSRAKGARGELEVAKAFQDYFGLSKEDVYRSAQRWGKDTADLAIFDDELHVEVKRPKRTAFWNYVKQVRRDKKENQVGAIILRPDGDTDWWIAIRFTHLKRFARIIERLIQRGESGSHQEVDQQGEGTVPPHSE